MLPFILTAIGAVVIFLLARKAIRKHRAGTLKPPTISQVFVGMVIVIAFTVIGVLINARPEMASIFAAWVAALALPIWVGVKFYRARMSNTFRRSSNPWLLRTSVATFVFLSLAMGDYFIKKGAHTFTLLYVGDEDPIRVGIIALVGILLGWMTYRVLQFARQDSLFRTRKNDEKGWLKFTRVVSPLISSVATIAGVFYYASDALPPVLLVIPLTFGALVILDQVEKAESLRPWLRGIARIVGMLGIWLTTGYAYYAAVNLFPPFRHYFESHIGTDAFGWTTPLSVWNGFVQIVFFLAVLACFAARLVIDKDKMVKPTK